MSIFMLFATTSFPLPCYLPVILLGGGYSSAPLHSSPLDLLAPLNSSSPPGSAFDSGSNSNAKTAAASVALFFAHSKSIPACSHHR